jgi:hypothetical protein
VELSVVEVVVVVVAAVLAVETAQCTMLLHHLRLPARRKKGRHLTRFQKPQPLELQEPRGRKQNYHPTGTCS